ncbi:hypothetical protein J6590_036642 [Homalodisca vitripennis]|nr:hypothetical protein J6590_036642 [Homalodisca vitripennis]
MLAGFYVRIPSHTGRLLLGVFASLPAGLCAHSTSGQCNNSHNGAAETQSSPKSMQAAESNDIVLSSVSRRDLMDIICLNTPYPPSPATPSRTTFTAQPHVPRPLPPANRRLSGPREI